MTCVRDTALRFRRIVIHAIKYILTGNKVHWYEVEHYYYMKKFKT